MSLTEQWLPVVGNSYYEVSNMGRIRGVDRVIVRRNGALLPCKGKVLRSHPDRGGYHQVRLGVGRPEGIKTKKLHRIVAEAWLGPCPDGMEVNHIDSDKDNNAAENLEYVGHSENVKHAYESGNKVACRVHGERHGRATSDEKQIIKAHSLVKQGCTLDEAGRITGLSKSVVSSVIRGKAWRHLKLERLAKTRNKIQE